MFAACSLCGSYAAPIAVVADYSIGESGVAVSSLRDGAKDRLSRAEKAAEGVAVRWRDLLFISRQREFTQPSHHGSIYTFGRIGTYLEDASAARLASVGTVNDSPGRLRMSVARKPAFIRMPEQLHGWLKNHCERTGVTINDFVVDLIRERRRKMANMPEQRHPR